MSISSYTENGKALWKVYVYIRSQRDRSKRFQKTIKGLTSESSAKKEERKLSLELAREAERFDGYGLDWDSVVHLWWQEVKSGNLVSVTERSAKGYLSILSKWTKSWNPKKASEISRADARDLLIEMERAGLSKSYQKKVRNIINKVYIWGIEFGHIPNVKNSP